jgi:flagellin
MTALDTSIANVNQALGNLGAQAKQIEAHTAFVSKLSDTLEAGVGNLVDADLARESARLQALQVQQQLGVQALSIANQAPQVILSLFK